MTTIETYNGAKYAGWTRRLVAHVIDTWGFPLVLLYFLLPPFLKAIAQYMRDYIGSVALHAAQGLSFGKYKAHNAVFNASGIIEPWMWLLLAVWVIFLFLNMMVFHGVYGRTLGKWLLGIRTVDGVTGRPPGVWKATVRWVAQRSHQAFPGSVLLGLNDAFHQTLPDKIARTIVVRDVKRLHHRTSSWKRPSDTT